MYMLVFAAILAPLTVEFDLSLTAITGIGSLGFLLFGLGSLPAGILTSVKNPKFMMVIYFLGGAVSTAAIGFSNSIQSFTIFFTLLGMFASIYHVAGLTLIAQTKERLGKSFGIHGVFGSAGVTIAPLFASIVATFWGWRWVYFILAAISIVFLVILLLDRTIPTERITPAPDQQAKKNSLLGFFIVFLFVLIINGFVYRAFLTIFPTHLSRNIRIENLPPLLTGGLLASGILAMGMIGQFVAGILSDRMSRIFLYAAIVAGSAVFCILIGGFGTGFLLILFAACFAVVFFSLQSVENSIISVISPPKLTGFNFGLKSVMVFGIGSIGSYFSGYITDGWGSSTVFMIIGFCLAVSAAISLYLALYGRKHNVATE
jgi:MFS family permease